MMNIRIPKVVLDAYSICYKKDGSFNSRKFNALLRQDSRIQKWFVLASKTFCFEVTPILVYYSSIAENLSLYSPVVCKVCGKILSAGQVKNKSYCSKKCAAQSSEVRNKAQNTMLNRYGFKHALQVKQFHDKYKQTCIDKYSVENPYASDIIKSKIKGTLLSKYGVDNPNKSIEIQEKIKQTNLEKYGTENAASSKIVRAKIEKTCKEKYGSSSPLSSKEVQDKSKDTWLKNLGVNNPAKFKLVFDKIKKTNLEKYGVDIAAKSEEVIQKSKKTQRTNFYDSFVSILATKNIKLLTSKEEYTNYKPLTFKCLKCNSIWTNINSKYGDNYQKIICENCRPSSYTSKAEKEVLAFIKSIYSGIILENRRDIVSKQELDIYLPEKKLAIEFNGDFYHSSLFKNYKYHQSKTLACRKQGIRLIHVFEHEWNHKREKVCTLIKAALGFFTTKIYARSCKVKSLSKEEYKLFLELNHFNGAVNSTIRYGLFYNDELVSVIGFGKSRFKRDELELHRFCSKAGYRVIGSFSKLLKHSGQTHFFSYVDLTHFDGHGYKTLGFSMVKITSPSYVYIKKDQVLNRLACQKHRLKKLLGSLYDSNLSEAENMAKAGWIKLYDSGNLKLEYSC